MKRGTCFFVSIIFFLFAQASLASNFDPEKELQKNLENQKIVIKKAHQKQKKNEDSKSDIARLKQELKDVKATHNQILDKFKMREEELKSLPAIIQQRHKEMTERYAQTIDEYVDIIEALPTDGNAPQSLLETLNNLVEANIHSKRIPIFGNLPYKDLNLPVGEPDTSATINPAYRGGDRTDSPDDLKDTEEAPISEEIATLAQSLNWNPVSIYEYVKNNIETEWYWGCMKGAEETLRQKSGNDCDQATLLTALLRFSGFPTRYVRGVIEFPSLGHVKNLTGIDDAAKVADFFQKAGIPHKSIISAGSISNFQIEHVWIESLIPYSNYRGAIIDEHGKTWLGLDTSIKVTGYTYNTPLDVFEGFSFDGLRDEYLGAVRTETPLEYIGTYVENYLNQNYPGMTYNDVLRTRALIPEVMNILPASMQYDQIAVTHEYTEIPDDLKHKIKLTASDTDHNELFTISFDSLQLSNRKVILSCEPETVEDQQTIDFYGGLDNTPAYLIRLRPVLELDGEMVAAGKDGLPMGTDFNLTIELISPNGTERITSTQITGNLSAIGFVAQKALDPDQTTISEEDDAETILFKETNRYIDNWNKGEDELASLLHLQLTRPVPTVTTIGGAIDVTYLLDIPHGFEWKGVYVDAKLRAVGTVGAPLAAPASENSQKTFMQLSALQGSILENRLFEDDFQVESISTAKLFQIVGANGNTPFLTVDKANIDTVLSAVELDDNIKEDITNAVNQGLVISIPSANGLPLTSVSYKDWTGIGYIKENPATGEAGYMLSGIIAGGMTVITPEQWAKQYLMEKLSQPYVGQYNYNPLSATKIIKIGVTDNQTGVVGKTLAKEIAVLVLDANGIPVKGARVTFKVAAGGGNFGNDFWGSPKTESESKTGSNGIAKAPYILGQETSANPIYRRINSSDEFVTQVGLNLVTASVKTSYGSVSMQGHFSAHGKPDIPKKIEKILGQGNKGIVNNPGGSLIAKIVDQYGNSISNLSIKFKTISTKSRNDSIPLPSEYRSLEFYKSEDCDNAYPIYGECATVKEINVKTEYFGAIVNTMMGNTVYTKYYVEAKNVDYDILSAFFELYTTGYRKRNDYIPPGLYISGKQIVNDKGELIDAAKAGTALKEPLTAELYMLYDEYTMEGPHACSGNKQSNCWTLKPTGIVNTVPIKSGTVNFSVIQGGGTLSATENLNNGKYRSKYTT
ncbi:MAG: hypothetical protein OEW04_06930, partial [Nitrospirota bacterium]|nr:hypothetical protein [Nitrospirota bacterium]